jgi:tetratricopeptide (TPR) repeat protein
LGNSAQYGGAAAVGRVFEALGFYLGKLFIPWPLSPYIPEFPGVGWTLAWLAVGLGLAVAAVFFRRRGNKLYLFCLLWFFTALLPALPLVVRDIAKTPLAERYLYLPSVGFSLCAGGVLAMYPPARFRRAILAGVAVLLAAYGITSFRATAMWKDDFSLWSAVLEQPSSARYATPWVNMGIYLMETGRAAESEPYFLKALEPSLKTDATNRSLASNGLGKIYFIRAEGALGQGRTQEAFTLLRQAEFYSSQAAAAEGADWMFVRNAGLTRLKLVEVGRSLFGRTDRTLLEKARQDLTRALSLSPGNPYVLSLLETCRREIDKAALEH